MADKANKLDKYASYTYYFELHASTAFEDLKAIATVISDQSTTRKESVDTLLINGRRDAHQTIDNVRFSYLSNMMDDTATMVACTNVTMEITEPGSIGFSEKLLNHAKKYNCSSIMSDLVFGLKIIFVGRTPDNAIDSFTLPYIIPMQLINISAKFTQQGGVYSMAFVGSSSAAGPTSGEQTIISQAASIINKNITVTGKTIQDALSDLETQLNKNYDETYETEINNSINARKVLYKIVPNSEVCGQLTLNTTETKAPDDDCKLTFGADTPITTMIQKIITSSQEFSDRIGESREKLRIAPHKNVFIPTIMPSYELTKDSLTLRYFIDIYKGGGEVTTFDYFFSDPGKNVDIIDFDISFPQLSVFLICNTDNSAPSNTNLDAEVHEVQPKYYGTEVVHPDTTRVESKPPVEKTELKGVGDGDIAPLPTKGPAEHTMTTSMKLKGVPSQRLAFATMSEAAGSNAFQLTFTIRGYWQILANVVEQPDGSNKAFGSEQGAWIRVNIFDQDHQPFFYTGLYQLLTVENNFSGGQFTQNLHVIMKDSTDE